MFFKEGIALTTTPFSPFKKTFPTLPYYYEKKHPHTTRVLGNNQSACTELPTSGSVQHGTTLAHRHCML